MKAKLLSTITVLLIATRIFAQTSIWTGSNSPYTSGAGTADNPYLIETADQLAYLAQLGSTNQYFKLMTDIDIDSLDWVPISSFRSSYFDGSGHVIIGLTAPLFDHIDNSEIKNIIVDCDMNIYQEFLNKTDYLYIGAISSKIDNGTIVEKCFIEGSINVVTRQYNWGDYYGTNNNYVGGVCGWMRSSNIVNCINKASISLSTWQYRNFNSGVIGGIVGCVEAPIQNTSFSIKSCVNYGNLIANNQVSSNLSNGTVTICAIAEGISSTRGSISYCYNHGQRILGSNDGLNVYEYFVGYGTRITTKCYDLYGSCFNSNYTRCYYQDTLSSSYTKTEAEMKGAAFPLTLNGTGEQLYITDVTPNVNNGYPLLSFQIVDVITYDTITRGENKMWGDIICSETGEYYYYSANDWGANKNVLRLIVQEIPISLTLSVNNSVMGTVTGGGNYLSNDTVSIIAEANYGYHFVNWSDGIATKERQIVLGTTDSTLIANFAINQYAITLQSNDAALGTVSGAGVYDYQSIIVAAAYPQSHCHFVQWSDGSTINPRYIELNQDTTFVAIFNKDQHILTVSSGDENAGSVTGSGTFDYYSIVEISATANLGYKFVQWSDGETSNPRQILIDQDKSITAQFEQCKYKLVLTASDTLAGNVYGGGEFTYGVSTNIAAIANEGYAFINWSDGNTDASRSIIMTEDLNLVANFRAITYTVSAVPNDETMGLVIGAGEYVYKGEVQLYAVPNTGYEFYKWSNGVTDNPYSFIATEDVHITAEFITAETSIDNIEQKFITSKIVKDGHIYIIRNGKCFTLQGIEVK